MTFFLNPAVVFVGWLLLLVERDSKHEPVKLRKLGGAGPMKIPLIAQSLSIAPSAPAWHLSKKVNLLATKKVHSPIHT